MTDIYQEIAAMLERGQEGTLVVVTKVDGHTPQIVGAKMVVRPDGSILGTVGGGRFEHVIIERALQVRVSGVPENATFKLKAELGMCCGGQMEVYMEPLAAAERLICFGAGHVAQSVVQFAIDCGFDPVVVDERPDWNSSERFSEVSTRHVEAYADFFSAFGFRPSDFVVITTHNHDHDREILALALEAHSGYIGMIGSVRKVKKTFKQLRLDGLNVDDLGRVHAPIGLDILAVSPAEIGLAIVGEMVRFRHRESSTKTTRGATIDSLNLPRAEKACPPRQESGVDVDVA